MHVEYRVIWLAYRWGVHQPTIHMAHRIHRTAHASPSFGVFDSPGCLIGTKALTDGVNAVAVEAIAVDDCSAAQAEPSPWLCSSCWRIWYNKFYTGLDSWDDEVNSR